MKAPPGMMQNDRGFDSIFDVDYTDTEDGSEEGTDSSKEHDEADSDAGHKDQIGIEQKKEEDA